MASEQLVKLVCETSLSSCHSYTAQHLGACRYLCCACVLFNIFFWTKRGLTFVVRKVTILCITPGKLYFLLLYFILVHNLWKFLVFLMLWLKMFQVVSTVLLMTKMLIKLVHKICVHYLTVLTVCCVKTLHDVIVIVSSCNAVAIADTVLFSNSCW